MEEVQDLEKAIRRQNKAEKIEQQQLLNDIKDTFSTPHGRRILSYILSICSIYSDVAVDTNGVFIEKGKRAVGLEILDLVMEADSEIYISLLRENADAR